MPATITTKAPVGPPIWTFEAAKRRNEKPGYDCGVDSCLRCYA
jgi:hypothetical protein